MIAQSPRPVADAVFNALGDPTRRVMVALLSEKPMSVSDLSARLGISKTAVGQHLVVLTGCQLARSEKSGRVRTCTLDPGGFAAARDWIDWHRRQWEDSLDRLGSLLEGD